MKAWLYRLYGKIWRWWYRRLVNGNEEILSTWQAAARLKTVWPNIKVTSPDKSVIVLPLAEMTKDIKSFPYWLYKWISELYDCDDFALCLHAHMRIQRFKKHIANLIPDSQKYPSAFGQIWGSEMMSVKSPHAVNVMICTEGIYVIEPQNGRIEKADPVRDKAWEVRF